MASRFKHDPRQPTHSGCLYAVAILRNAHNSASSLLNIFDSVCGGRRKRKSLSDDEQQDLLRAMLIFASAGLDAMVKQLIKDALRTVINQDEGATAIFKKYIERRLAKEGKAIDHHFLADILGDSRPRDRLLDSLISELTQGSFQSATQLFRVAEAFNIRTDDLHANKKKLDAVFRTRNQIAHEMDVDFAQQEGRTRRLRDKQAMIDFANEVFGLAAAFLNQVDAKLSGTPSTVSPDLAAKGIDSELE
ncbi:MAG TPA: HEPN domain-containing protein [Terriglobia bacterium]|nr:HEPN domain-containing protein [Terriglobia bacterium]